MLYQLSYASKVRLFCPLGVNSPPDPFLMSGTIVKGTTTAIHVQGEQAFISNSIGALVAACTTAERTLALSQVL